jgi:hypothetical protein
MQLPIEPLAARFRHTNEASDALDSAQERTERRLTRR